MASKAKAKADLAPKKVTQAQIQQRQAAAAVVLPNGNYYLFFSFLFSTISLFLEPKRVNLNQQEELTIEQNVNRLQIDGASARNVDDAIHVLQ